MRSPAGRFAVLVVALVLAGCTSSDPTRGPTVSYPPEPSPPVLTGRVLVVLDGTLAEVGPNGAVKTLAGPIDTASVSRDGTWAAYTQRRGSVLTVQKLPTAEERPLTITAGATTAQQPYSCVSWSPDGSRLAVGALNGFFVTDVSGRGTLVDVNRHEDYAGIGAVYSQYICGGWLNASTVVFNRMLGPAPKLLTYASGHTPTLGPDTTTLARLGSGAPVLADKQGTTWQILDRCGEHVLILRGGSSVILHDTVESAIADPGNDSRLLPSTSGTALFLPDGCAVATSDTNGRLVTIEPATRQPGTPRPLNSLISPKSLEPGRYATGPLDTIVVGFWDQTDRGGLVVGSYRTGAASIIRLNRSGEITAVLGWLAS